MADGGLWLWSLSARVLKTAKEDWSKSLFCPWVDEVFNTGDCVDRSPSAPSDFGWSKSKRSIPIPHFLQNVTHRFLALVCLCFIFHRWLTSVITAALCPLIIPDALSIATTAHRAGRSVWVRVVMQRTTFKTRRPQAIPPLTQTAT